jgi:hypothetical protein
MTAFECQEYNRGHCPVDEMTDQQGKSLGEQPIFISFVLVTVFA